MAQLEYSVLYCVKSSCLQSTGLILSFSLLRGVLTGFLFSFSDIAPLSVQGYGNGRQNGCEIYVVFSRDVHVISCL